MKLLVDAIVCHTLTLSAYLFFFIFCRGKLKQIDNLEAVSNKAHLSLCLIMSAIWISVDILLIIFVDKGYRMNKCIEVNNIRSPIFFSSNFSDGQIVPSIF